MTPASPALAASRPAAAANPWVVPLKAVAAPRLRVLCLPFAGGGTAAYRPLAEHAPADVEVLAARLPGRETRFGEPPVGDVTAVVNGVLEGLAGRLDAPLALFGHSMGTVIVHDLAYRLIASGTTPAAVVVSGRRAPFVPRRRRLMFDLSDAEFITELRRMGGTPPEVFEHKELLDLVLPVLRADFRLAETFDRPPGTPFPCPVVALAGAADADAPPEDVERWGDLAGAGYTFKVYPGGHFFIHDHRADIMDMILTAAAPR